MPPRFLCSLVRLWGMKEEGIEGGLGVGPGTWQEGGLPRWRVRWAAGGPRRRASSPGMSRRRCGPTPLHPLLPRQDPPNWTSGSGTRRGMASRLRGRRASAWMDRSSGACWPPPPSSQHRRPASNPWLLLSSHSARSRRARGASPRALHPHSSPARRQVPRPSPGGEQRRDLPCQTRRPPAPPPFRHAWTWGA